MADWDFKRPSRELTSRRWVEAGVVGDDDSLVLEIRRRLLDADNRKAMLGDLVALSDTTTSARGWAELARIARDEGVRPAAAVCYLKALVAGGFDKGVDAGELAAALTDTLSEMQLTRAAARDWLQDAVVAYVGAETAHLRNVCKAAMDADARAEDAERRLALARVLTAAESALEGRVSRVRPQRTATFILFLAAFAATLGLIAFAAPPVPESHLASKGFWAFALWVWAPMLVLSWLVARNNAQRTRVAEFVSPLRVGRDGKLIAGEHEAFITDLFYHIFQFIWLPIIAYLWLAEINIAQLVEVGCGVDSACAERFSALLANIHRPLADLSPLIAARDVAGLLVNEQAGWMVAGPVGAISLYMQWRIQHTRRARRVDFYWWDIRCGWQTWLIRWIMVGVDMAAGFVILQKLMIYIGVLLAILFGTHLHVSPADLDEFGGLSTLRDAIAVNAFGSFIVGVFVFSSWYMHNNLAQYRASDAALGVVYAVVVFVAVVAPALRLESILSREMLAGRELIAAGFTPPQGQGWTPDQITAIDTLRGWRASMFDLNLLNSPLLLLLLQAAGLTVKAVQDQRKRLQKSAATSAA